MSRYERVRENGRFARARPVCEIKGCTNHPVLKIGADWRAFEVCSTHAAALVGLPAPARWI
jgi:hypothetical protein